MSLAMLLVCSLTCLVFKSLDPVPKSASALVTVPGGTEGPGGVLVMCEDTIIWRGLNEDDEVQVLLPRRE